MLEKVIKMERKLILFGAGKYGRRALYRYGADKVSFICDNNVSLKGKIIEGVEVISFHDLISLHTNEYLIMITPIDYAIRVSITDQLEEAGVRNYCYYDEYVNKSVAFNIMPEEVAKENDSLLRMTSESFEHIDLLTDILPLEESYRELKCRQNISFCYSGRNSEGYYYGNLDLLVEYSGINKEDLEYAPIVSHYDCMPALYAYNYDQAVVMSGRYHAKKIHKKHPYVPLFTVGPYIHYAKGVYSKKEVRQKKEEIGKMLLVFLPHSLEDISRPYNKKDFIDNVIRNYRNGFDTIWLCVYWVDILDDIVCYAKRKGIHVVSSGYRFDPKFNCRQRSMFELADAIACGDLGTFVNYALYFKKPIARVEIPSLMKSISYEDNCVDKIGVKENEIIKYVIQFENIFNSSFSNGDTGREWMEEIAGFSNIRSPEYIKNIFQISKEIWLECNGNMRHYPDAVRSVYYRYLELGDFDKVAILLESVGARLE